MDREGEEEGEVEEEEGEGEGEGEICPMCESIGHLPLRGRCPKRMKPCMHCTSAGTVKK